MRDFRAARLGETARFSGGGRRTLADPGAAAPATGVLRQLAHGA